MGQGLFAFILKRLLQAIPLLFAVIILNFFIIHLAPGDPIQLLLRDVSDERVVEAMRKEYGLDNPIHIQLAKYILSVCRGNLGHSIHYNRPVLDLVLEHMGPTLLLMLTALGIATIVGITIGTFASTRPFSRTDNLIALISLAGYSMPIFWLGQVLVLLFSIHLDLFPSGGMYNLREQHTGLRYILDVAYHLTLPAICFATYDLAFITRITRTSMLEVIRKDYVTTARSKGLPEKIVVFKHLLRNALIPVVTVIGMSLGLLFAGSVLTETVFSWPGLGRLTFESISARDYPVLMGIFIVVTIAVLIGNFIADILYSILDPRIRET